MHCFRGTRLSRALSRSRRGAQQSVHWSLGVARARPIGTLRLLVQRSALAQVVEPVVPLSCREYPDVKLEIGIEAEHMGLVGAGLWRGRVDRRAHRPFIELCARSI